MINNKAISILKGLSKSELIKFEKFLESPYFNTNKNIVQLFKVLVEFYPAFNSNEFQKKTVHERVYGKEKYNDIRIRKLFSDFYKLGERFIVINSIENNEVEYNKILLDELDWRKIDNIFLSKYSEREAFFENSGFHYQTFFNLYYLRWQIVSYHLDRGEQFKIPGEVFERTEQLIFFFLSDLFGSLSDISVNRNEFNYNHSTNLPQKFIDSLDLESVYKYIEENDFKHKNFFSMHYYVFQMNKHFEDETHFEKLRELVDKNIDRLNKYGKMNFILRMISYCNRKINKNKSEKYTRLRMDLYDQYIKYKLYKSNKNYFRSDIFMLMFMIYLGNDISRAEHFLEENIRSVSSGQSKNLYSLCKSLIHFENGNFGEALALSSRIRTNVVNTKIILRKLLMKIYYETSDYDVNKDEANNFRHFVLNSKSLTEINKNSLLDFYKYFNDLIKLKNNSNDDFLKNQLTKNIDTLVDPIDREWFVKKLG